MRTRLGRTPVEVTRLGFGGGPLGGLFTPVSEESAAAALAAAWDCGIRYFDTSPHYGIGVSERLLNQNALDDLLPACAERGVSVLAASIFNSGVLAMRRPSAGATFDYDPASPDLLRRAHAIADVCEANGVTLPQAAMAFPLRHPAVAGVVVGMRSPAEVQANVADFGTAVPSGLWSALADEHLIDRRAVPTS